MPIHPPLGLPGILTYQTCELCEYSDELYMLIIYVLVIWTCNFIGYNLLVNYYMYMYMYISSCELAVDTMFL
jgi:hypothetical protein